MTKSISWTESGSCGRWSWHRGRRAWSCRSESALEPPTPFSCWSLAADHACVFSRMVTLAEALASGSTSGTPRVATFAPLTLIIHHSAGVTVWFASARRGNAQQQTWRGLVSGAFRQAIAVAASRPASAVERGCCVRGCVAARPRRRSCAILGRGVCSGGGQFNSSTVAPRFLSAPSLSFCPGGFERVEHPAQWRLGWPTEALATAVNQPLATCPG
jgi:hypothetical protein